MESVCQKVSKRREGQRAGSSGAALGLYANFLYRSDRRKKKGVKGRTHGVRASMS